MQFAQRVANLDLFNFQTGYNASDAPHLSLSSRRPGQSGSNDHQ
jgi:hypothetical protein